MGEPSKKEPLSIVAAGDVLGDYEIVPASAERLELGAGAMGAVYLGRDRKLGRLAVIKTIQTKLISDPRERAEFLERFVKESIAAAACHHPSIVTLYCASEPDERTGFAWYAMEHVKDSIDLAKWLDQHLDQSGLSTAPFDIIVRFLEGAAAALREIHGRKIVHRDVKPANFLVCPTPDGLQLKLLDFGIAYLPESELTATRTLIGTPGYISPERARAYLSVGPNAEKYQYGPNDDLYALGVMAYRLITGRKPHWSGDDFELLRAVAWEPPADVRELRPDTPVGLQHVTMRLLAKEPLDRFRSAQEVLDALRQRDALQAFQQAPVEAPPVSKDALTQRLQAFDGGSSSINAAEVFAQDGGSAGSRKTPSLELRGEAAAFAAMGPPAEPPKTGFKALPKRTRLALMAGAGVLAIILMMVATSSGDEAAVIKDTGPVLDTSALVPKPEALEPEDLLRLERQAEEAQLLEQERSRRAQVAATQAVAPTPEASPAAPPSSVTPPKRTKVAHSGEPPPAPSPAAMPAPQAAATTPARRKDLNAMFATPSGGGAPSGAATSEKLGLTIDTKLEARLTSALSSDAPGTLVTAVLERPFHATGMPAALPAGTKLFGRADYRFATKRVDITFTKLQLPKSNRTYEIGAIAIEPDGKAGLAANAIKRDERAKANTGEAVVDAVEGAVGTGTGSRAAGRFTQDERSDAQALRQSSTVLTLPLNKKLVVQFLRES